MKLIQREIKAEAKSVRLASTPRWLLSSTPMEVILADSEKRTASVEITVIKVNDKDVVIRSGIWFSEKRHRADAFIEICRDTLCSVCSYWGH